MSWAVICRKVWYNQRIVSEGEKCCLKCTFFSFESTLLPSSFLSSPVPSTVSFDLLGGFCRVLYEFIFIFDVHSANKPQK